MCTGAGFCSIPCMADVGRSFTMKVRLREVTMNRMAAPAVSFARKGAAPVLPKTVWLEPPKAAPMPAPLPCCNSTMEIRAMQTMTWIMIKKVIIMG